MKLVRGIESVGSSRGSKNRKQIPRKAYKPKALSGFIGLHVSDKYKGC